MAGGRLIRVCFRGGPRDGRRERIQAPLPPRLLVPVFSGRERTWGRDETVLVGVVRYELRERGRTRYYAIVKEDSERGDQG